MTLSTDTNVVDAANRCVACGLCLPQCPTYQVLRNEADSPRGRISLIKALAQNRLAADDTCVAHLEKCLMCRRCEAICPAQVPFGWLMDKAREDLFAAGKTRRALPAWMSLLVRSHILQKVLFIILWLYVCSGLRALLHRSLNRPGSRNTLPLFKYNAMLPKRMPRVKPRATRRTSRQTNAADTVTLFTGCVGGILDSETLLACTRLLEAAGYNVAIPKRQSCCGALHQHAGDYPRALSMLDNNAEVFESSDTLVSCASGCGLQLAEDPHLATKHADIHAFLLRHIQKLKFRRLEETAALHTPCTMRYMNRDHDTVTPLLEKIAGLDVKILPSICCGAAGAYMINDSDTADTILADILAPMEHKNIDILLTSNVGCALHFRQALAKRNRAIEVLHPATLLARQLDL